jgi:3-dehydroquinate dehydratase II
MRVLVINGPNLNLLGTREPEVYGTTTLSDLERQTREWAEKQGIETSFFQSNSEGALIDAIQAAKDQDGIVINPAAYSHTSRAIGDAILAVGRPTVEVHISNIFEREPWRALSLVTDACVRTIYGRGVDGYQDAIRHLLNRSLVPFETVAYGPLPDQVADLRLPDAAAAGVVTLIHGGFWMRQYERDTVESLATDLTKRGFVTWNVEYRRLGTGGGWPGSPQDVEMALAHLERVTDVGRGVTVIGHSAGGHLALTAGRRQGPPIAATIGLAPVTDLALVAATGGTGSAQARALLAAGAPQRTSAPDSTFLIHGDRDELVPVSHSTRLSESATVEIVEGGGHFEMLSPRRPHWDHVIRILGSA